MSRLFDDASSQYLRRTSSPVSDEPFTIAAWCNTDDLTNVGEVASVGQASGSNYHSLEINTDELWVKSYDGSSAYALRLRDGQGPFAGQQFIFLGEFRYLNLEKVRHVIKTLGGAVVETASPALTYAVLGEEEYAAYEAGNPSPQVAEIAALVEQGATVEIVDDDNLRGWIIDGWY